METFTNEILKFFSKMGHGNAYKSIEIQLQAKTSWVMKLLSINSNFAILSCNNFLILVKPTDEVDDRKKNNKGKNIWWVF